MMILFDDDTIFFDKIFYERGWRMCVAHIATDTVR
jgi:hypothetical protein